MSEQNLPWEDVESSNILRVAFVRDGVDAHGTLYVEFHGARTYRYLAVSFQAYTDLLEGESVGGHLNAEIKPHYPCERIGD